MKVYLAAAFNRKREINGIAQMLIAAGVTITSRWLNEKPCPEERVAKRRFLRETALMDLADIREADVVVRFSDPEVVNIYNQEVERSLATGARHFECGYALAQGKPIIVVGGVQNVFDYLPNVSHVPTIQMLIEGLQIVEVTL